MSQLNMPNGGLTSLDEHEVSAFPIVSTATLPGVPTLQDPTTVEAYLVAVKAVEVPAFQ